MTKKVTCRWFNHEFKHHYSVWYIHRIPLHFGWNHILSIFRGENFQKFKCPGESKFEASNWSTHKHKRSLSTCSSHKLNFASTMLKPCNWAFMSRVHHEKDMHSLDAMVYSKPQETTPDILATFGLSRIPLNNICVSRLIEISGGA